MHTDFVLDAPLPIAWSRTYCSQLRAYDRKKPYEYGKRPNYER
ncbi:DUF6531 domain-containing protein [uncultured Massilia sp.]